MHAAGASAAKHSAAVGPPIPEPPCANAALRPTPGDLAQINIATLCVINQVRVAQRLRRLRFSSSLQSVAIGQARDMVLGDYFGDRSLAGLTPLQRIMTTRYPGRAFRLYTAQNIGWATGPLATPSAMVAAWMRSPPHRKIMLTPSYQDIGVGVAPAAPSSLSEGLSGATYTIEFAQRILNRSALARSRRTLPRRAAR